MQGIIALDIDGTLTDNLTSLPPEVVDYLHQLHNEGWTLFFLTGRTFTFGFEALKALNFPYYFGVQNGALILEMPSKKILSKRYLGKSIVSAAEQICLKKSNDLVICMGYELSDRCYYRPQHLPRELLTYLNARKGVFLEEWQPITSYDEMTLMEFPSIKCFAQKKDADAIAADWEEELKLNVPVIQDPFGSGYHILQATATDVSKGNALKDFIHLNKPTGLVIAAGDDYNDESMLKAATVRIAMANAPKRLLALADIVAAPAAQMGIIDALKKATR